MNKGMLGRTIEALLSEIVDRSVEVTFAHLGQQGKDYSVSIQTTLYEFDENVVVPKGPMYITLNNYLLQDTGELLRAIKEIVENNRA